MINYAFSPNIMFIPIYILVFYKITYAKHKIIFMI